MTGIGSKELISFPDENVFDVVAKVDTGADYSAVWASDIIEADGELQFKLFGKGSQFYTGKTIRTTNYGVTKVRNSFGHSEQRYKITLLSRIGGRKIRVEFSLADRSNNRYPVLIGKKTLARKFYVDVSVNSKLSHVKKYKVLALSSKPSASFDTFFNKVNDVSTKVVCDYRQYDDFSFILDADKGIEIVDGKTHQSVRGFDLIYFKTYFAKAEIASVFVEYAQMYNINFADTEVASYRALTKVSQYARLARFGVPIPQTIIVSPTYATDSFAWIAETIGLPFVFKDAAADRGESNYLIRNEADFIKVAQLAQEQQTYYVAQKFIPNTGDYRIIMLDKKVNLVIHRQKANNDTHLNNTSTGGVAKNIDHEELPSGVIAMAAESAHVMKREVAGVDVIQDSETKEWMVLEVNNSPQTASGAYTDEKLKAFAAFLRKYAAK